MSFGLEKLFNLENYKENDRKIKMFTKLFIKDAPVRITSDMFCHQPILSSDIQLINTLFAVAHYQIHELDILILNVI